MSDDHSPFPDHDDAADDGAPHDDIELHDDADESTDHDPLDELTDDGDDDVDLELIDDDDDPLDTIDDPAHDDPSHDDATQDDATQDDVDDGDDDDTGDEADDPLTELRVGDDGGPLYGGGVADLLDSLGIDATTFERTMNDLGLAAEADARSVAVTFEQLGVDAHVEHGDFDRLADLLADGAEVRLGGDQITGLDDLADEAIVTNGTETWRVPLDELDADWSAHTNEMVVADAPGRTLVLLPADSAIDGGIRG